MHLAQYYYLDKLSIFMQNNETLDA